MNPFPLDQVVPADPADTKPLACLIAEAFHPLEPSVWLVPDEEARREIFPEFFQMYVEEAFARGLVYTTVDLSAVALWLENSGSPQFADPGHDEMLETLTSVYAPRFRVFDRELDPHHPVGIAHHHLAILAVHPAHQRCGIGTALLARHHQKLDETGTLAYLEASDADTRELYLRHGYSDLGSGPIVLPEGPRMYPMIRPALQEGSPVAQDPQCSSLRIAQRADEIGERELLRRIFGPDVEIPHQRPEQTAQIT